VTLVDLDTKIGTLVNGEQIRGKAYVLDQDRNIAVLARSKCHLMYG
jgi:nibrin